MDLSDPLFFSHLVKMCSFDSIALVHNCDNVFSSVLSKFGFGHTLPSFTFEDSKRGHSFEMHYYTIVLTFFRFHVESCSKAIQTSVPVFDSQMREEGEQYIFPHIDLAGIRSAAKRNIDIIIIICWCNRNKLI